MILIIILVQLIVDKLYQIICENTSRDVAYFTAVKGHRRTSSYERAYGNSPVTEHLMGAAAAAHSPPHVMHHVTTAPAKLGSSPVALQYELP